MGKGDKKTRRGKLFSGSFGVLRARKKRTGYNVISSTKKVVVEKVTPAAVDEPIPATKEAKQKPEAKEKQPLAKQPKKPVLKKDPSPKEETAKKEK
ncbi:MAG: 30S ribosomal protein THX [Bacteroidales bacterium]